MSLNVASEWFDTYDAEIARREAETGIPSVEWKAAGRKSKAKPNGEDVSWWRDEGVEILTTYQDWLTRNGIRVAEIHDEPAVEWGGMIQLPSGVMVKLFIDLVVQHGDSLMVVDLKSGSRKPPSVGQLALYATAVELATGERPPIGGYYMFRAGELTEPEDLTPWGVQYFDAIATQLRAAYRESIFIPKVDTHCVVCGVSRFCYANRGPEADKFDVLANPSLRPLTEDDFPPHLSWSQISSWLWCGKQAELTRLRGAEERPAVYTAAGVALHSVAEKIALAHHAASV